MRNNLLLAMETEIEEKQKEIDKTLQDIKVLKKALKRLQKMYIQLGGKLEHSCDGCEHWNCLEQKCDEYVICEHQIMKDIKEEEKNV